MKILVYKSKHYTEYFKYETRDEKLAATKKIFDENIGYYNYPEEDAVTSKALVESQDLVKIHKFVWNRSYLGHEYEELEIETLQ